MNNIMTYYNKIILIKVSVNKSENYIENGKIIFSYKYQLCIGWKSFSTKTIFISQNICFEAISNADRQNTLGLDRGLS